MADSYGRENVVADLATDAVRDEALERMRFVQHVAPPFFTSAPQV